MSKKVIIPIVTVILLLLAGWVYYWFFYRIGNMQLEGSATSTPTGGISFNPFARNTVTPTPSPIVSGTSTNQIDNSFTPISLPILRHLSTNPIGGFMASTTASSSVARYIDRGVGHVYEARSTTDQIVKISNTTIPRIYESYWNRNLTAMVLRYLKNDTDEIVNFFAEIKPIAKETGTSTAIINPNQVNYEIKGKFLSSAIREIATSPKGDQIFTLNIEDGRGIGYISGFDESKKTKILDTPLTQLNADWPEDNTATLITKPSGLSSGYLYFVNVKTGVMTKILGKITGLNAKVSADAKKVLFSSGNTQNFLTSLYNLSDNTTQNIVINTIADKCVWSRLHTDEVYCAVPVERPVGLYPDDWYKGKISFVDQIWHLNTTTGEVHLLANLLTLSNSLIDAVNLTLDPKEDYLYFTNKRDLTLWSLDLNQ